MESRVLLILSLCRGICLGLIVPGIWWSITMLDGTLSDFSTAVSCLMGFRILGELTVSWRGQKEAFSKFPYIIFWGLSILGGGIYLLSYIAGTWGPYLVKLSLLFTGLWVGLTEKSEFFIVNELKTEKQATMSNLLKLQFVGQVIGSLLGWILSYIPKGSLSYPISILTIPSMIQIAISISMMIFYGVNFERLSRKRHASKPMHSYLLGQEESSSYSRRLEGDTLQHEGLSFNRNQSPLHEDDIPHTGIFTSMLLLLIFSFSYSLKQVAIPILLMKSDVIQNCRCVAETDVGGIYVAFIIVSILEALGVLLVLFFLRNNDRIKWIMFVATACSILGQALMISNEQLVTQNLVFGMAFLSFALPFGMISSKRMLYYMIGNRPQVIFPLTLYAIEFIGNVFGPFWTVQAYQVKCGLCFSFILIFLLIGLAFLLLAWRNVMSLAELLKSKKDNSGGSILKSRIE